MQKRKKSIIIINDKGETEKVSKKASEKEVEGNVCPRESCEARPEQGAKQGEASECCEKCKKESCGVGGSKDCLVGREEASRKDVSEADGQSCSKEEESKASSQCPKEPLDQRASARRGAGAEKDSSNTSVPPMLNADAPNANKEIFKDRDEGNTVAEGWMWKKRRIFSCFWHQKYFVLTRDGVLRYHKADGRRDAKGNWDMKESTEIRHYNLPSGDTHPFRILVFFPSHSFLLAFDDRDAKDHWVEKLNEAHQGPKR